MKGSMKGEHMKPLFNIQAQKKKISVDDKYTHTIQIPQYLPSDHKPEVQELYNKVKYTELCKSINNSKLPDDEKQFLKLAASRHIIFNYSKIADYYAHSNAEMQKLMEQSALVIIALNDAIANGYVRLSKNIEQIMEISGRRIADDD